MNKEQTLHSVFPTDFDTSQEICDETYDLLMSIPGK